MHVSKLFMLLCLGWQGFLVPSINGKYINTPCQANSDCGLDNHLQCIDDVCQCDSISQIYDGSTFKCLLLAGQDCQTESADYAIRNKQHSQPMKCVPHADCVNSVCRCSAGYRFSPDFLCKPDFGSSCYSSEDCDDSVGLTCTNGGICDCQNTTLTYQGQFGCIDPNDPTYTEMLNLLNQTDFLLRENDLDLKDMFNDLGLQNEAVFENVQNMLASERQFQQDTYNTRDLQFAAQNQAPQQQPPPAFNIQQLITLLQTFQSLVPRNPPGGGFFRNLFGGGMNNNNQGGYPESSSPAPASGYGPPGQPEGMGQRMGLLNTFLNLFNQMIPIVRQLRMRFMPFRFFRNLLGRFAPQTTQAPPPAQQIQNPPPTVIQSNGNYQTNPLFSNIQNNPPANQPAAQTGPFQFFQRTRERFRNFLRGNNNNQQQQSSQGGYDSPPGSSYGPPGENSPPPGEGAQPTSNGGDDIPESPPSPSGTSQQSSYLNNHRPPPRSSAPPPNRSTYHNNYNNNNNNDHDHGPQSQSQQYSTIHEGGHQAIPPPHPTQRNQNFANTESSSSYSGGRPNHDSFYDGNQSQQSQRHQQEQQQQPRAEQTSFRNNNNNDHPTNDFNNNRDNDQNQQYNAQATSHRHQTTFTGQYKHPPSTFRATTQSNQYRNYNPKKENVPKASASNTRVQYPHISGSASPPPIPQYKSERIPQVSSKRPAPEIPKESPLDNFIFSEADDPHPGFTPHSESEDEADSTSPASKPPPKPHHQQQREREREIELESFRTSARFERIGKEEQSKPQYSNPHQITIDQKWRETF